MDWTEEQLATEWLYRHTERLGILCGSAEPTAEERKIAIAEADECIERIKAEK